MTEGAGGAAKHLQPLTRNGIQQVLAELDSEQLKNLPVDDWIELPASPNILSLAEGLDEVPEDES